MKHSWHAVKMDKNTIVVASNFDNGNLYKVEVLGAWRLQLSPMVDNPHDLDSCKKTFFHFSVSGVPPHKLMRFHLKYVSQLQSIPSELYRPYYRHKSMKNYERLPSRVRVIENGQLQFEHQFQNTDQTFFAFGEPYSYARYLQLIDGISSAKDCLVREFAVSYEKRLTHLVVITQKAQSLISKGKMLQVPQQKAVVMVTARVHAGQSPSSHLAQSLIHFLLSEDPRAVRIKKHFVFLIVPMLNPDGVFHGNYRFDTLYQNLNRCYQHPISRKQPTIFGVKKLMEDLNQAKSPPLFFFDLHAHASTKGFFLYGNAIDTFSIHLQNVVFSRLLNENDQNLEHTYSNFSKRQMRHQKLVQSESNKQGCARVTAYKLFNIAHSYTVELGFHTTAALRGRGQILSNYNYSQFGKNIITSILDLFGQNPKTISCNSLNLIREEVAKSILQNQQRFKNTEKSGILKKQISQYATNYYSKKLKGKSVLLKPVDFAPRKSIYMQNSKSGSLYRKQQPYKLRPAKTTHYRNLSISQFQFYLIARRDSQQQLFGKPKLLSKLSQLRKNIVVNGYVRDRSQFPQIL